ncbi:MAG TPA: hypothetical protein VFE14_03840 [Micromonosporaceae bacterium]|jgi:serine/threonine-protein kinase|nr:hypothetical protein [Micromonosporaceae bacterium]
MRFKGPILTLVGGLTFALILLALNLRATPNRPRAAAESAAPTSSIGTAPATSGVSPQRSAVSVAAGTATYAGSVDGGSASIAIAVHGTKAAAYLCDGRRTEAWLTGTAIAGTLALTSRSVGGVAGSREGNGTLTGTYDGTYAAGTLTAAGRQWTFRVKLVQPPSGIYRASANVRNAVVVGTWIRVNGTQVGVITTDDIPTAAPPLDTTTNSVTVGGVTLNAAPVDPATLPG